MKKTLLYDEVVSIETAILAKTAGFDADCKVCPLYYCEFEGQVIISPNPCPNLCRIICMAPTQPLLQRWLREEKKVEVYVRHFEGTNKYPHYFGTIITDDKGEILEIGGEMFDTYELALEDALKYALENLVLL